MNRLSFALLFFLCVHPLDAQGRFKIDTVPAPSLRENLLGDPDRRAVAIYLPRGYETDSTRRYPVVYLLHGFGGGYEPFLKRIGIDRPLDSLTATGALKPMIFVVPDANNSFTGSFFRNSPITGNWEDFVARDLVTYVDRNYRTISSKRGRGIAGWSMGGYGALFLAVRHPEIFSAVYALSPCCMSPDLPEDSLWKLRGREGVRAGSRAAIGANFNANIVMALGAIYTPDPAQPPFFVRLPWTSDSSGVTVVSSVARHWRETPLEIIRRSSPRVLRSLRISFDAGDADAFPDIPLKARELHEILLRKGIPHEFEIFRGTHGDRIRERIETRVLPFFSRSLSGSPGDKRDR